MINKTICDLPKIHVIVTDFLFSKIQLHMFLFKKLLLVGFCHSKFVCELAFRVLPIRG